MEEKTRVQELYLSALVYVTVVFLEAEENRRKELTPMISALVESFERNPTEVGRNLYAAGFFVGAVIFGLAVGSPVVLPVIGAVSLVSGLFNFIDNHR